MSTLYSVGQMNQLGDALETAGFTPDDVTKLRSFPQLGEIRSVLKGNAKIVATKHIIDCDASPHIPDRWEVRPKDQLPNAVKGQFEWDLDKVILWLSENQKNKTIKSTELRKELENQPVFNANVLDYLLAHPELIPEEWKGRYVFFWGTIYRDSDGDLNVRCLDWSGGRWDWNCRWIGDSFAGGGPA